MEIRRSQIGEVVVLGLQGKFISDAETTKLETAIDAETEAGTSRLVIDMSECAAMNSTALGILVKTRNVFERRGARVKLSALPPLILADQALPDLRLSRHPGRSGRRLRRLVLPDRQALEGDSQRFGQRLGEQAIDRLGARRVTRDGEPATRSSPCGRAARRRRPRPRGSRGGTPFHSPVTIVGSRTAVSPWRIAKPTITSTAPSSIVSFASGVDAARAERSRRLVLERRAHAVERRVGGEIPVVHGRVVAERRHQSAAPERRGDVGARERVRARGAAARSRAGSPGSHPPRKASATPSAIASCRRPTRSSRPGS